MARFGKTRFFCAAGAGAGACDTRCGACDARGALGLRRLVVLFFLGNGWPRHTPTHLSPEYSLLTRACSPHALKFWSSNMALNQNSSNRIEDAILRFEI